jgi:hypothetical protein
MGTETKVPQLPRVTIKDNPELQRLMDAVIQTMEVREGRRGDKLDKAITYRDLVSVGLAKIRSGLRNPVAGAMPPGSGGDAALPVLATPPAPEKVEASPGIGVNFITWRAGSEVFANYANAKLYRATSDNFGAATYLGAALGGIYVDDAVTAGQPYYYWVTFVSTEAVEGPAHATSGVTATPINDPAYLIDVLSEGQVGTTPFMHLDEPTVINGVTVPAGTYMRAAYIHNAAITNAAIANAAITSAKIGISEIKEANIEAGSVTNLKIGDTIQSTNWPGAGWYLHKSGVLQMKSANSTTRMEILGNQINVYENGVLRVRLGQL